MAIEVFNRYEKKYRIRDATYQCLRERLGEYMEADAHSRDGDFYTICNIYYDTPDNYLIRKSVDGSVYKEKLRLRSYGVKAPEDKVFLEIKKKYKRLVNKRRTKLGLAEAYQYMQTKERPPLMPYMNSQVLSEIDYMVHRMELSPKVFISYDRCAMFGKENKDFRVTFDRNITTRRYDLGLHYGIYGDKLLDEDEWIMEVKIEKAMPLWMSQLLSEYGIYPASFSKYGTEYKNYVAGNCRK
ncbi:MAG: polyphosphate polymerase domain-containing protein [Lachnospiraceae bacterium]|nr:polyphosphate polymerase domain-containing protein [Lachnospiraceae bacterium]MBP3610864.1 polyphosphate polymerase domain-containing protein [Lachnospiraceae bacterium]